MSVLRKLEKAYTARSWPKINLIIQQIRKAQEEERARAKREPIKDFSIAQGNPVPQEKGSMARDYINIYSGALENEPLILSRGTWRSLLHRLQEMGWEPRNSERIERDELKGFCAQLRKSLQEAGDFDMGLVLELAEQSQKLMIHHRMAPPVERVAV